MIKEAARLQTTQLRPGSNEFPRLQDSAPAEKKLIAPLPGPAGEAALTCPAATPILGNRHEDLSMQKPSEQATTSASGYDLRPLSGTARERLAAKLTPEERRVILDHGTERPFCGTLLNNKQSGIYACRLCGLPLFQANAKFESGTGWPSFYQPLDPEHITELRDISHGMIRTEIRCRRCDGHLGHVFPDGPPPTHQRYCLNSASMEFYPEGQQPTQHTA
jgi:peptide-methionine (R)-S-oxide reductase